VENSSKIFLSIFDWFQSYGRPSNTVYENPVRSVEITTCGGFVVQGGDAIIIGDRLEFSWLSKKFKARFLPPFPVEIL